MTTQQTANIATVRAYLAALETFARGDTLARFFSADAVQVELPNQLNPRGGRSDLPTLLQRAESVPCLLSSQRYDVLSAMAQGSRVVVEAVWSAVLAAPFSSLAAGSGMKAHFAIFIDMQDGRITSQRNYDCFEPW